MREFLKKMLELTRPYRTRFVLGLACGFLSGVLASLPAVSLKLALDTVFPNDNAMTGAAASAANHAPAVHSLSAPQNQVAVAPQAPPPAKRGLNLNLPAPLKKKLDALVNWFRPPEHPSRTRLILVISLIPAAMLLRSVLAYLNTYWLSWVGIRAANDLRVRLFKHLIHMPLGFFNSASTGDLSVRIEGAMSVHSTIKDSFGVMIREPVSLLVVVVTLFTLQPVLSIFTLLIFPVCLLPVVFYGRKFRRSFGGVHGKFANLAKVIHESFTGIRVVKGYNLEDFVVGEFQQATQGYTSFFMRAVRAGEIPGPLIEFLGSVGVAMVFVYFAFFATGHAPAGDMLAYFFLVFSLYAPLKNVSRLNHNLTMARACVEPAYEILAKKTTLPEPVEPKPLKARGAPIRFENVSFSYGEKTVLHGINLTIQPGQMVALVGRTGSGKTSIANLLLRFYDPQAGAILIGDTDIRQVSSHELRNNIAVVTQETILFNDTIRRNIALGRLAASDAEIETAARHAYADEFIRDKKKGYETQVGEKGSNISGGQRQRIAIARAILRDAPILILDEATNALDPESEKIVQTALEELSRGRTTVCIAHRLSTVQKADLIVVLDAGRIIETGTHEELLRAGGLYSKFHELSFEPALA